jgi:predicted O-methyltransferase YrrM
MNPPELEYLAYRASVSLTYAEIGSWRGKSARAVADNLVDGGVLFCIDTWADHAHGIPDWWTAVDPPDLWSRPDWLYREFMKNISDSLGTKIFALRMDSVSAARALEGVKMFNTIFIDAGHTYEEVKADILAWKPLLNPNGVMCGHDFHEVHHPGVVLAVRELVPEFRVVEDTTVWTTEPE